MKLSRIRMVLRIHSLKRWNKLPVINPSAINKYHLVLRSNIFGLVELICLSNEHLNMDPVADVTILVIFSKG